MFSCKYCQYTSNWSSNLRKHEKAMHKNEIGQDFGLQNSNISSNMQRVFDIRLKENFKLFVSGPSRCGKTVFVAKWYNVKSYATKTVFP